MKKRSFLNRKADRFKIAKFTCVQCRMKQSQTIPIGNKSARCIDCKAPHKLSVSEVSETP